MSAEIRRLLDLLDSQLGGYRLSEEDGTMTPVHALVQTLRSALLPALPPDLPEIRRYLPFAHNDQFRGMVEDAAGEWVKFEDVTRAALPPDDSPVDQQLRLSRLRNQRLLADWREQDQALQDIVGLCGIDASISCPADVVAVVTRALRAVSDEDFAVDPGATERPQEPIRATLNHSPETTSRPAAPPAEERKV